MTKDLNSIHNKSAIRSFMRRSGRPSKLLDRAWEVGWPLYGLTPSTTEVIALEAIFGNTNACVLEIGFGNGISLSELAKDTPNKNFIGVEVYRRGIGQLMGAIGRLKLENLKVVNQDAVEFLSQHLPDHSLDTIQLLFPDPWPKKRHHKRRLIQQPFLALIAKKLKKGGCFYMATDWEPYAADALTEIEASGLFKNCAGLHQFADRESRTITKFEARGHRLGHQIRELSFRSLT